MPRPLPLLHCPQQQQGSLPHCPSLLLLQLPLQGEGEEAVAEGHGPGEVGQRGGEEGRRALLLWRLLRVAVEVGEEWRR